ncbi:MAG: DUF47 family protein [Elusimicrobiota bacterium]
MWLFTKEKDFFKMLLYQTIKVEEGLALFLEFINNPTTENGNKVNALEEEVDEIRRVLIEELNYTFVTPIDREDIFALSRAVDDIIDYAKSTVEEMTLFEIQADDYIKKMVEALHLATKDISHAVKGLKDRPTTVVQHLIRARKMENFVEHRYREGLVELFKSNDFIKIFKTREIYRHLSNAADRVTEAANTINDILVKIT